MRPVKAQYSNFKTGHDGQRGRSSLEKWVFFVASWGGFLSAVAAVAVVATLRYSHFGMEIIRVQAMILNNTLNMRGRGAGISPCESDLYSTMQHAQIVPT